MGEEGFTSSVSFTRMWEALYTRGYRWAAGIVPTNSTAITYLLHHCRMRQCCSLPAEVVHPASPAWCQRRLLEAATLPDAVQTQHISLTERIAMWMQEPLAPGPRVMRRSVSNGTRSLSADVVFEPVCFIQHVRFLDSKEDPDTDEPHIHRCYFSQVQPCNRAWISWVQLATTRPQS